MDRSLALDNRTLEDRLREAGYTWERVEDGTSHTRPGYEDRYDQVRRILDADGNEVALGNAYDIFHWAEENGV